MKMLMLTVCSAMLLQNATASHGIRNRPRRQSTEVGPNKRRQIKHNETGGFSSVRAAAALDAKQVKAEIKALHKRTFTGLTNHSQGQFTSMTDRIVAMFREKLAAHHKKYTDVSDKLIAKLKVADRENADLRAQKDKEIGDLVAKEKTLIEKLIGDEANKKDMRDTIQKLKEAHADLDRKHKELQARNAEEKRASESAMQQIRREGEARLAESQREMERRTHEIVAMMDDFAEGVQKQTVRTVGYQQSALKTGSGYNAHTGEIIPKSSGFFSFKQKHRKGKAAAAAAQNGSKPRGGNAHADKTVKKMMRLAANGKQRHDRTVDGFKRKVAAVGLGRERDSRPAAAHGSPRSRSESPSL